MPLSDAGGGHDFPIVEAFGSFTMDMFTIDSDLDLSINFSKDAVVFPREKTISVLRKFSKVFYTLQNRGHVHGLQPILSARVPILKVVDSGTGIECDISVENKDGIAKSKIIGIVSSIDKRFRVLSFLMKAWAKAHDINSSKDRTLNSLSIISLVAFHLQTRDPPILPPFSTLFKDGTDIASLENSVRVFLDFGKGNEESVADLFVTLLIKLSSVETLWPKGLCASTYEGSWISKTWDSNVGNISVEDFCDRSQNIARAVGKAEVQKIYKCIRISLTRLSAFMQGQIEVPKLKTLLFGPKAIRSSGEQLINNTVVTLGQNATHNAKMNHKRSIPSNDSTVPVNPWPVKRMRHTEATGVNRASGAIPRNLGAWNTDATGVNRAYGEYPSNVAAWYTDVTGVNQAYGENPGNVAAWHNEAAGVKQAYGRNPGNVSAWHTSTEVNRGYGHIPGNEAVWSAWRNEAAGVNHAYGEIPRNVAAFPTPPLPPFNPPPQLGYGFQHPPIGFQSSHGPNPMFPAPYTWAGHIPSGPNQNVGQRPPFYPFHLA
ncbi:uncharacterized protein LOC143884645 isoform X2 [Tasmannia lanceolata]|uniref:uncharacterized protein LOC143884645 isoform X2 n=1 Tax=Tasmannia lanceolata TaxID=3420 RepID=UPI0040640526